MNKTINRNNRKRKVLLFTTRFLESDDVLFNTDNILKPVYCKSPEYINYFISDSLPTEIVKYLNKLYYLDFFNQNFTDKNGLPISKEDDWDIIKEKIRYKFENTYTDDDFVDFDVFFSDLNNRESLSTISFIDSKFDLKKRDVKGNEKCLLNEIKMNEGSPYNEGLTLNTDFGGICEDKKTIDRRFKIYKLNTNANGVEKFKDVPVFGVWCLGKPDNETAWYNALYQEIKSQMGDDFKNDLELLFFLHDGDVGERIPFKVIHYKDNKDKFDFLIDDQTLSVSIFQHSLSPIADALSTTDIDKALEKAEETMIKGGIISFLDELSDYVAYWQYGGKEEYIKVVGDGENINQIYGIDSLVTDKNKEITNGLMKVEDVYREIKKLIDCL